MWIKDVEYRRRLGQGPSFLGLDYSPCLLIYISRDKLAVTTAYTAIVTSLILLT